MGILENNQLHPSVEKFKTFVKSNPKLIEAVKKGTHTWQELFEEWFLLGEEDPRWAKYLAKPVTKHGSKETETIQKMADEEQKKDWLGQILGAVKQMDAEQLSMHVNQLSQTLTAIQGVLSQFQGNQPPQQSQPKNQPPHPFQFRKD